MTVYVQTTSKWSQGITFSGGPSNVTCHASMRIGTQTCRWSHRYTDTGEATQSHHTFLFVWSSQAACSGPVMTWSLRDVYIWWLQLDCNHNLGLPIILNFQTRKGKRLMWILCLLHRRRKDFLIGGSQSETTHRVVSNLYNKLWNMGGHMPPVPPPGSYAYDWSGEWS